MTPIRNTYLLLLLCLFAGARSAQAQCSANAVAINVTCSGQSNGYIDLTPANGSAPYTYLWSNNATTEDISALPADTYTCTVTDALACTTTTSATVTQPDPLVVNFDGILVLNCVINSAPINAIVSGGTPPYNYNWFNGESTSTILIQSSGNYSITVLDANACSATANVTILEDASVPVAMVAPPQVLTCMQTQVILDATASSIGPNYTYSWSTAGGNIVSGANTPTPTVSAPGTYWLVVTNVTNGCTSNLTVSVLEDIVFPLADAGPSIDLPCSGGIVTLAGFSSSGSQFTYIWTGPGILSGAQTLNPVVNQIGTYSLMVTNTANGCTNSDATEVTSLGLGLCGSIEGRVVQDTAANCVTDAGDPPLSGWIVKATGALGDYFAVTDSNGNYQIHVEAGYTYVLSATAPSPLWLACPSIPDVTVANQNDVMVAADLLYKQLVGCPLLSVDLSSGNLRRCFDSNFFSVSYCNYGTEPAEDAYVVVTLDAFLSPLVSSLPYTSLGNGALRFEVGDLASGECGSFYFFALLSCDAVLGQTHCSEAHIYPDSSCIPNNAQWSGASLRVSSECQPDSLHFRIENVGSGNMPNMLDYIVIEDQVMVMSAPVQLNAGEFITVSVPANGSTWRVEVEQEPFHPGQSSPAVSVEGCTTGSSFSTGFVTLFPADDGDEFVDIDCKENVASSDPNDKHAFPSGYGVEHYILPGTPLEYQIRFQNTGNDTAFTVRIVDTLSSWLNPATIRPGASSHPYTWDLSGAGVLTFLFENILLPDSNVNEAASHGFVKFTINHATDAPLETVIENTADIYFDFNDAVVTNTTFHRLGEHFVSVELEPSQQQGFQVLVSPNPFADVALLEVKGRLQSTPLHLQVFDLQGKIQLEMETQGSIFELKKGALAAGLYIFTIDQAGKNIRTGKLIIQD